MFLDKVIFVIFFFFAGLVLTGIVAFGVLFLVLKKKGGFKQGGGSVLSMGSVLIAGVGGVLAAIVAIVLVSIGNYEWLYLGVVGKYILYFFGAAMALSFVLGIVAKVMGNSKQGKKK